MRAGPNVPSNHARLFQSSIAPARCFLSFRLFPGFDDAGESREGVPVFRTDSGREIDNFSWAPRCELKSLLIDHYSPKPLLRIFLRGPTCAERKIYLPLEHRVQRCTSDYLQGTATPFGILSILACTSGTSCQPIYRSGCAGRNMYS
jgi:hypothetical protein